MSVFLSIGDSSKQKETGARQERDRMRRVSQTSPLLVHTIAGHFWDSQSLCFKMRLRVEPLISKWIFIMMYFHKKNIAVGVVLKWDRLEIAYAFVFSLRLLG